MIDVPTRCQEWRSVLAGRVASHQERVLTAQHGVDSAHVGTNKVKEEGCVYKNDNTDEVLVVK